MALDLTAIDSALKVFYLDSIREQVNNSSVLYQQIDKDELSLNADGKSFTFQLHTGRHKTAGDGRAEGGTYPTASNQSYGSCIVPNKYIYTPIEISGQAIYASKTSQGSAVQAIDSEIQGAVRDTKRSINRQFHGDGRDALAFAVGTDVATPANFDDGQANAFTHLEVGMTVDLIDTDNSTVNASARVISTLSDNATSVAVGWTGGNFTNGDVGDYFVKTGTLGAQMMGIRGIISDADPALASLQGLAVASNPFWKAQLVTAGSSTATSPADLTIGLLQKPITRIALNSDYSKKDISFMLSNMFVQDKYAELCVELKRLVGEMDLDGGWTGLSFNGLVWVTDPQCQRNVVYYIVKDALRIVRTADLMWQEKDGNVLHRLESRDAYIARLFAYMNLATPCRNALGKLQYIAE